MVKLWGREPALWLGLVAALVKCGAAFGLDTSTDQQALINATAAAVVAFAIALIVRAGRGAALVGALQALLALAVGFGLHLGAEQQATVMTAVSLVVAMWTRSQVTAPVAERAALPPADPAAGDTYGG